MRRVSHRRWPKAFFARVWTSFFAMRSEFARFKPRKHEAVSTSGTRRDHETKIDLASLGGFVGGHGNHADPLSPDQRHTFVSKIRPVLPQLWPRPHMICSRSP